MKKNEKQWIVPAINHADENGKHEHHPHIVVVRIAKRLDSIPSSGTPNVIECTMETDTGRFQILVLDDTFAAKEHRRFTFLRLVVDKICGMRIRLFQAYDSLASNRKFLIDRMRKELYIDADFLGMPLSSIVKMCDKLPKFLNTASKGIKSAVDGFGELGGRKILRVRQKGSLALTVSDKGLRLPSGIALSVEDRLVHVSLMGDEIYIRSTGWRLFHKASVPLPYFSYKIEVSVDGGTYLVALPPDVINILRFNTELRFDVSHLD